MTDWSESLGRLAATLDFANGRCFHHTFNALTNEEYHRLPDSAIAAYCDRFNELRGTE